MDQYINRLKKKIKKLEEENKNLKKSYIPITNKNKIKNEESVFQKNEEKYRLLVEQQTELIIKFDINGKLLFVSPSYCILFGKKEDQLLGTNLMFFVHEDDKKATTEAFVLLHNPPYTCQIEHRAITSKGIRWLAWSNKAITDNNGNIIEIIGVGRDVTSRKNAQLSLQRHVKEMDTLNRFLRRLTSSLTIDDVINSSVDTLAKSFDQTLVAFFLLENDKVICKQSNIKNFKLKNDILYNKKLIDEIKKSIRFRKSIFFKNQSKKILNISTDHCLAIIPCSGNKILTSCMLFCSFSPECVFIEQQTFLETLCNEISVSIQNAYLYEEIKIHSSELSKANKDLLKEIKDREKVENELEEKEKNYMEIFNATSEAILVHDPETGKIVDFNKRVLEMYKCKHEDIVDASLESFGINDDKYSRQKALALIKKAAKEGTQLFEWKSKRFNNELFWSEITLQSTTIRGKPRVLAVIRDITERKNAERVIFESEEKYRNLFENAADGIIIFDKLENILDINDSFCRLVSKEKNDLLSKPFSALFPDFDKLDIKKVTSDKIVILEKNLLKSNNRTLPVEIHIKPLGTDRFQAFFRDITERTIAEQKLIETNNLLHAINNASPDTIFILNVITWKFTFFNKQFNELFKYSEDEIKNAENIIQLLIHKDDKDIVELHFNRLFNARDNVKIESEIRLKRKDGKIIWVLLREQVFSRDSKGNVIETVGAINDISERKKAEEEILLTNSFLQAIFNTSPDVIFVSDFNTHNIFYISKKIETLSHYSLEYCINSKNIIEELIYEEDKDLYYKKLKKIEKLKEDELIEFEFRLKRKDKKIIWTRVAIIIFKRNEKGKILQTLGMLREITERKIAHQKLIESETKFRNIFNTSTDGIAILNNEKKIIEANQSLIRLSGMKKKDLFSIEFPKLLEPSLSKKISNAIENCRNKKSSKVLECNIIQSDKKKIPSEIEFKSIEYEGSVAVLALIHDISERKEAEKKVFDAIIITEEKERETFAKNLHDDLGPLLSSIRMYLNSFQDTTNPAKQEYIVQQVNSILKEAIQCTKDVSNDLSPHILTNYGLVSAIESFITNFSDLVSITFKTNMKNHRFENKIEMTIFRIIKELTNNTLKHAGATYINIILNYTNDKISISYQDNGKGFDFEEKSEASTIGMGVFNIKNRVKTLNGTIDFEKQKKGVKYIINIPAKVIQQN